MSFASIRKKLRPLHWLERWRNPAHRLGRRGERTAGRHLKQQRFRILARNYRCVAGEIDLICSDADTLVFVEVKTRSDATVQGIEESVHPSQWRRLQNAARYYVHQRGVTDRPCRFDLVTVLWRPSCKPEIEHFRDVCPTGL